MVLWLEFITQHGSGSVSLRTIVSSGRLHGGECHLIRDSLIQERLTDRLAIHREQLSPVGNLPREMSVWKPVEGRCMFGEGEGVARSGLW